MDFGSFMGLGAVIIGIISVTAILMEGYKRRLSFKERQLELSGSKSATPTVDVERLEARLRVLERIATAKSTDLAAQIEDLREPAH